MNATDNVLFLKIANYLHNFERLILIFSINLSNIDIGFIPDITFLENM